MGNDCRMRLGGASSGVAMPGTRIANMIGLLAGLAVLALATPALAQEVVGPGESVSFVTATDGADGCRRGSVSLRRFTRFDCGVEFLGETAARPNLNEVETSARLTHVLTGGLLGVPLYSEASVSNDFFIPGPPDNIVTVHITVSYDFFGNFVSGGLYTLQNSLSLRVQDRSYGTFVASQELVAMQRQGDQGFTDVALAQEREALPAQKAHFTVKLRRGGLYRLHFELRSSGVTFIAGLMRADAFAKWHILTVSVDEDEVEQLDIHDMDIKARLKGIEDDLAEIKELLRTPQGLRPGFPIKPSPGNMPFRRK